MSIGEGPGVRRGLFLAGLIGMGMVSFHATRAFSQGTSPTGGPGPAAGSTIPPLGSTFSPEAEAARFQSIGNQMTRCMGSAVGNSLQNLGRVVQGGSASCEGPTGAPENLSCETFTAGGRFNTELFRTQMSAVNAGLDAIACKRNRIASARAELACLSQMSQDLQREVSQMQRYFTEQIQQMNNRHSELTRRVEDFDAQLADVTGKLTGAGTPGAPGLLGLRQQAQAMIGQMPTQIGEIQEANTNIQLSKRALEEQVRSRQMGLTSECFSTKTEANYRCEPNGPPKTAMEYAVCRHQQNRQLGRNGRIEENAHTRAQAQASADALKNVLDRMMADIPRNSRIPTSQQENQTSSDPNVTGVSLEQIEARYGPRLQAFNLPNMDIHRFIMGAMRQCYQRSTSIVERERRQVNSTIGVAQQQVQFRERENNRKVRDLLNRYSQQFSDAMTGLTGRSVPLDVNACANGTPEVQSRCLRDAQSNLEGLLSGSSRGSAFTLTIRGTQSNVRLNCEGLNGCIAKLQDTSQKLNLEKRQAEAEKRQFSQSAGQSMQRFVQRAAEGMARANRTILDRIGALTATLAGFGVNLTTRNVDSEQIETDPETGLPRAPRNIVNLIGSAMSPPMVDLTGNNFSSVLSSMSQATSTLGERETALNQAKNTLTALETSCGRELVNRAVESLSTTASQLTDNDCSSNAQWCRDNQNALGSVLSTVSALRDQAGSMEGIENVESTLQSGIATCAQTVSASRNPAASASGTSTSEGSGGSTGQNAPSGDGFNATICNGVTRNIERSARRIRSVAGQGTGTSAGN